LAFFRGLSPFAALLQKVVFRQFNIGDLVVFWAWCLGFKFFLSPTVQQVTIVCQNP
jgi:hypothetical protein